MVQEGEFVEVEGLSLGIGKVADLHGSKVEVQYFGSPASGVAYHEVVALERVRPITLTAQTRVHWQDEETGAWLVGRVAEDGRVRGSDVGSPVDLYFVEMPNERAARVPIPLLQVRWNRPVEDPVAFLASRTTETPFWHEGRRAFLRGVVEQRARCQGMTGIWSSCLELTQHQASAVRTVLTDPVQRYLLADEVGLGKTIEAGAILRQYTLDEPTTHSAIVIVPSHLVSQWTEELVSRFYLDGVLGDSVHVVSSETWSSAASTRSDWGMLIVDEAHHLAASAFSTKESERHAYQALASLARSTPRLILLSATPVLRNEAGFLAMLHLLEPDSYPLDDLDGFRMRVESRQEIAEALSDLQEDAQAFFLEDALDGLDPMITGDTRAEILSRAVRDRIDDDEQDEDRIAAIRALRDHVGEVYRLHRRLIRHRRESMPEILRGRTGVDALDLQDPVRTRLGQLLEQWREAANLDAPKHLHPALSDVYWFFLNAALSHPSVLQEAVRSRIDRRTPAPDHSPRVPFAPDVLLSDLFPGERRILDAMLAVADADSIQRLDPLLGAIDYARQRRQKAVVFADTPAVADRVATALSTRLSGVLRHSADVNLGGFSNPDGECGVLVCDRTAEEGLNLQRARARAIHLDLPLDLGRLEQRLGRIDRFGSRIPAKSVIFNGADPIEQAWAACTRNTAKVFDRSIASLQYVLEDQLAWLRSRAFAAGIEAVQDLSARLSDPITGLEAELRRIRTQEQLDTMSESTDIDAQRHEELEDFDVDCEEFQPGLEAWAVRRLQFGRMVEERGVVRYRYNLGRSRRTLVSLRDFIYHFAPSIDPNAGRRVRATHPLSFSRSRALRQGAQLARFGHPFVDALAAYARSDDRGAAYLMWRYRRDLELPEDPWLVFGFDFLVEADQSAASWSGVESAGGSDAAIRRHLDILLPPRYETQWVDQELSTTVEPKLREALSKPYEQRALTGRDYNLSSNRWSYIRDNLRIGSWPELCQAAYDVAADRTRSLLALDKAVEEAENRIQSRLESVRTQLRARQSRDVAGVGSAEAALNLEEALAAGSIQSVRSPRLVPDSAFAVFLSTTDPFAGLRS